MNAGMSWKQKNHNILDFIPQVVYSARLDLWRGGRVVEGARLESV